MSTFTDGAPPSVAPEPADDTRPAQCVRDGAEDTAAGTGSSWLEEEIQRRMAAKNTGSGGRHARRNGTTNTVSTTDPNSFGYVPRHSTGEPTAAGAVAARPPDGSGRSSVVRPRRDQILAEAGGGAAAAWSGPQRGPRGRRGPQPETGIGNPSMPSLPAMPGSIGGGSPPSKSLPSKSLPSKSLPSKSPPSLSPASLSPPPMFPPAPGPAPPPAPPSGAAAARLLAGPPSGVGLPTPPLFAPPAPVPPAAPLPAEFDDSPTDWSTERGWYDRGATTAEPSPADEVLWSATAPPMPVAVPEQRTSEAEPAERLRGARFSRPADTDPVTPNKRVRVVLAERKGVARPVRTVIDVQEGTPVGELLRSNLIGSQLSVALRFAIGAGFTLGVLPLLFAFFPEIGRAQVLGLRLPWLLLGVLVYPFLLGLGWWHTRTAERVEQNFADHVQD